MSNSAWKVIDEQRWRYYNNIDHTKTKQLIDSVQSEQSNSLVTSTASTKSNPNKNESSDQKLRNFFYTTKKFEVVGTQVYTPMGYGILCQANKEKKQVTVKLNKQQNKQDFACMNVYYDITLDICLVLKGMNHKDQIIVPVSATVKDILQKIEEYSNSFKDKFIVAKVLYQGKQLESGLETIEKIGMKPHSKLLILTTLGEPYSLQRYKIVYSGWGFGNSIDAISFMVSKDVKLAGFGIYKCESSSPLLIIAKIVLGDHVDGQILAEKQIIVENEDVTCQDTRIHKVLFSKPINCKINQIYSCVMFTQSGTSYYGSCGREIIEGEKNVTFSFQTCKGSTNGTGPSSGQLPEIYYFI